MADYVVRMTGQDNLSGTIKQVKSELNDLGKTTSKLDQIDAKFSKITNSTAPLKKQLRDLKTLMAQMNMDGLANTEQYTKIAQEAGKIKDAMDDAAASARRFSSDTASLDATIQAFQGIAAVGTIATGAMGLFGKESKEVEQAILKVQSALAILNGIQQVANVLNKNSALIEKLKGVVLRSNTAATVTNTAATAANTTATVASTAATQAWNVAKAIGKALLGDWTGLLLVGGAALATYALTTSSAADAQEDLNKKNEEGTSIEKKAIESATEQIAKLRTLYSVTQDQTRSLQERNAAADEMRAMNPDILSGLSNESILAGDAADAYNDMADAIIRIAMAEAAYDRIKELTKELLELEEADRKFNENIDNLNKNRRYADPDQAVADRIKQNYGIDTQESKSNYRNPRRDEIEGTINYLTKTYGPGIVNSIIGGNRRPSGFRGRYRRGGSTGGSGSTPPPSEEVKGIIANHEKEIQDLKKQINEATSEELIKSLNEDLKKKEAEFTQFKIDVGLEVDPKIAEEEEAKKKAEEIAKKLFEDFQASMNEVAGRYSTGSTFDKLIGDNPFNTNSLEGLKRMMDATENSLKGMYDLKKEFEDAGDTGSDAYQQIIDKIKELEEELDKLGIIVIETKEKSEKTKKIEDTFNKIGEAAGYTGQMFSSLGQMAEDNGLKAAGIIAETIAQLALGYAKATVQAADLGPWAWVAFGLAGAAQLAAMVAQIHSLSGYASGGIISGGSSYGDQILARVNAGEMILNRRQQSNLFRAIESGDIGAGNTVLVPEFKIKGSDLYGTLRNFSKSVGKTGKVTGIR